MVARRAQARQCPAPARIRLDPSAATVHVPPAPDTSTLPEAGSLNSAAAACGTPSAWPIQRPTVAPAGDNASTSYPIATITKSGNKNTAQAFVNLYTQHREKFDKSPAFMPKRG